MTRVQGLKAGRCTPRGAPAAAGVGRELQPLLRARGDLEVSAALGSARPTSAASAAGGAPTRTPAQTEVIDFFAW